MGRPKKEEAKSELKQNKESIGVQLAPLNLKLIKINIVGTAPLIMDKLPQSVLESIVAKQTGVSQLKKGNRDIDKEIKAAMHTTNGGTVGFPAAGFKKGMMEVTSFVGDKSFSKKLISGAVRIKNTEDGLIPIKSKKQDVLVHNIEHNVKYSPAFHDWSCELVMEYDANNISPQDIIETLNYAGHYIGVGAWRPKCRNGGSGEYGTYKVSER
jgi:hypothetical protein